MRRRHPDDQVVLGLLTTQLGDVLALLSEMNAGPEGHADPSRAEHQEEELSMTRAVDEDLRRLGERVRTPEGLDADEHAMVERMRIDGPSAQRRGGRGGRARGRRSARSRTARRTDPGLDRGRRRGVPLGALLLALRAIVLPLKALQKHTEALGRGEFGPGPGIDSGDEIGALASAFETMASRVAATQVALERRVATRTRELAPRRSLRGPRRARRGRGARDQQPAGLDRLERRGTAAQDRARDAGARRAG
jgi:HAMP domain-containing protein